MGNVKLSGSVMQEPTIEVTECKETKKIEVSYRDEKKTFDTVQEAVNFARQRYLELVNSFGSCILSIQRKFYYDKD